VKVSGRASSGGPPRSKGDMSSDLLVVDELTTHIRTRYGVVRAVEDVSIRIGHGEVVALVGESGSGKTMTALSIARLLPHNADIRSGRVIFDGRDLLSLREEEMREFRGGRIGFIFQDPSSFLNPVMTVGEQIAEVLREHQGARPDVARSEAVGLLARVRISSPDRVFRHYPHQLSGGMRQRALIAMAIACRPALLIADEPTTALDVTIQAQVMRLLVDLTRELDSSLLLITHDLGLVAQFCDRVYVMYAGRVQEHALTLSLFDDPKHPYSKALLASTIRPDALDPVVPIPGQPPSLVSPPSGCRFHPRCMNAMEICSHTEPPLLKLDSGADVRCWLYDDGRKWQ
jgi:peptide/nickel transport system ATP-binding protein